MGPRGIKIPRKLQEIALLGEPKWRTASPFYVFWGASKRWAASHMFLLWVRGHAAWQRRPVPTLGIGQPEIQLARQDDYRRDGRREEDRYEDDRRGQGRRERPLWTACAAL